MPPPRPRPGQLQLVVHHHERVRRVVHHVLVHTDPVQVLLEDAPQVAILPVQTHALLTDGHVVQEHLVEAGEENVEVVPLLHLGPHPVRAERRHLLPRGLPGAPPLPGARARGRPLGRGRRALGLLHRGGSLGLGLGLLRLGDCRDAVCCGLRVRGQAEGHHLLHLRLQLAVELRQLEDPLRRRHLALELLDCRAALDAQRLEPPPLSVAELVHAPLELLVVSRHDVLLVAQRPVALLPLPVVGGDLGTPVRQRVLQADELPHPLLDDLCGVRVALGQLPEGRGARVGGGEVGLVRALEVPLELLNGGLEGDLEHVVLLRVAVLDLLALRLELLPRLRLGLLELLLHGRHDVLHILLLLDVPVDNLGALRVKLLLQGVEVEVELLLQALDARVLEVDQRVEGLQVRPERHLVLLLGILEVAVQHLDDGILAVHLALVVLGEDLDLFAKILHLGQAHDLAPLVVDLDRVDDGILLLL
mmetsp:Transcript_57745/g.182942  ORF Transcript_57745/g.182942 Transcript_57745/m.182942 type:complete len:476 (-) Transcript_57745:334-1761(-)